MSDALVTASDIPWGTPTESHVFRRLGEAHYSLEVPECATVFDVDQVWRDRQRELSGELVVTCHLKGARTYDGALFSGRVNLSTAYRRRDVCQHLRQRASTANQVDWDGLLDELAARVVKAEREGQPAQLLSTFKRATSDDVFNLEGIILPKHHPSIIFGDGGSFKSFLGLYIAGYLAQCGIRVMFADWELEGEDHRDRLERLFGPEMPPVFYQRQYQPMVDAAESLKREIQRHRIQYLICDSVGFATNGAPESAEAATGYFRALRTLNVGSAHIAHVTKPKDGEQSDPTRPFGSTFWHNAARATWFMKRTDGTDEQRIVVAIFNRKMNLGALRQAVGLQIDFTTDRTFLSRVDIADVDELASSLPIWQRMKKVLTRGPLTLANLADELGATDDQTREKLIATMDREVRRKKRIFTRLTTGTPDGIHRIALVSNRDDDA